MKRKLRRRGRTWVIVAIIGITFAIVGWRRIATRTENGDPADSKVDSPSDVVVLNEQQVKQISTEVVREGIVTLDRKATGKVSFNEDRLTPVFTPYSGRISELLANKGDAVKAGQALVVVESPDYVAAQNDLATARSDVAKSR